MSSTRRQTKFEVSELFNGQNYHSWKKDIRMLLNGEEAYKITIGSGLPPNPNAILELVSTTGRLLAQPRYSINPWIRSFKPPPTTYPVRRGSPPKGIRYSDAPLRPTRYPQSIAYLLDEA